MKVRQKGENELFKNSSKAVDSFFCVIPFFAGHVFLSGKFSNHLIVFYPSFDVG